MNDSNTAYYSTQDTATASGTITPEIAVKMKLRRVVQPLIVKILEREMRQ